MNSQKIEMKKIRTLIFNGAPAIVHGLRPIVWKLLLGTLSTNCKEWEGQMDSNLKSYEGFKKELIVKPQVQDEEMEAERKKY